MTKELLFSYLTVQTLIIKSTAINTYLLMAINLGVVTGLLGVLVQSFVEIIRNAQETHR